MCPTWKDRSIRSSTVSFWKSGLFVNASSFFMRASSCACSSITCCCHSFIWSPLVYPGRRFTEHYPLTAVLAGRLQPAGEPVPADVPDPDPALVRTGPVVGLVGRALEGRDQVIPPRAPAYDAHVLHLRLVHMLNANGGLQFGQLRTAGAWMFWHCGHFHPTGIWGSAGLGQLWK